jgi:intracellular sulfur oxidation DsrE/DsrF family protein
MLKSTLAGVA